MELTRERPGQATGHSVMAVPWDPGSLGMDFADSSVNALPASPINYPESFLSPVVSQT